MEIKEFDNKTELEFEFFKDYGNELEIPKGENRLVREFLNDFFRYKWDFSVLCVLKIDDEKVICYNVNFDGIRYYSFENNFNLNVGDFVLLAENYGDKMIFPFDKSFFNKDFFNEINNLIKKSVDRKDNFGLEFSDFENISEQTLTKELFLELVNKSIKKQSKEEAEKRIIEKKRKKEEIERSKKEELRKRQNKDTYAKTGVYENEHTLVQGKDIRLGANRYILEKEVKDILPFEFFENNEKDRFRWGSWNENFDFVENRLIEDKINYIKEDSGKKVYEVKFLERGVEVNGIKITKSRLKFILTKLKREDISKEEIKILNRISEIKYNLLNLKVIECRKIEIPVKFSIVNENKFNIQIMERSADLDWNYLKNMFFYGTNLKMNLDEQEMLNLISSVGITKQEFFDIFRRKTMVRKLKNGSE